MAYYINRVQFASIRTVLRIYKTQGLSQEEVLAYFSAFPNRELIHREYETLSPLTVPEAIQLGNVEQRMVALRSFEINEIIHHLEAVQIDEQTLVKRQIRWDAHMKAKIVEYQDTYSLFKIRGRVLGIDWWWREPAIYFVKCQCPSTQKNYFIYVSDQAAANQDAVEAIAWTMRFRGKPLSKEQYLHYMYAET
ncbi:MAG: hypothetical protein AAFU64_06555 [Bacteroidota bacterium]